MRTRDLPDRSFPAASSFSASSFSGAHPRSERVFCEGEQALSGQADATPLGPASAGATFSGGDSSEDDSLGHDSPGHDSLDTASSAAVRSSVAVGSSNAASSNAVPPSENGSRQVSATSLSLERLRAEVEKLERRRGGGETEWVSTGCRSLDRLLSVAGGRAGVARGSLTEWFSRGAGSGAATMAWSVACAAARSGGYVVVLDRQRRFYPPAAVAWGVEAERLAVVRVEREEDELWVVDQTLRSSAVAAVWVWRDELSGRDFRRWQLAAEAGGAVGVVLRPARARGQPTWADVQLQVEPAARACSSAKSGSEKERSWRLAVELVRCRGGVAGTRVVVEWDGRCGEWREVSGEYDSDSVSAVTRLAGAAAASRGAGAREWGIPEWRMPEWGEGVG